MLSRKYEYTSITIYEHEYRKQVVRLSRVFKLFSHKPPPYYMLAMSMIISAKLVAKMLPHLHSFCSIYISSTSAQYEELPHLVSICHESLRITSVFFDVVCKLNKSRMLRRMTSP